MDHVTLQGWIVKGVGGGINILEMFDKEGLVFTDHWFGELDKLALRIVLIVENQKSKREQ